MQKIRNYSYLDDAPPSPNAGNAGEVQIPFELKGVGYSTTSSGRNKKINYLFRGLPHQHEALRIRNDLRRIQCLLEVIDELLLVALEWLLLGT